MASCTLCDSPMELDDGHDHCISCLGPEHLKQAFSDPCPSCSCLPLAICESRLACWNAQFDYSLLPIDTTLSERGVKRAAGMVVPPPKKKKVKISSALERRVDQLTEGMGQIQAFSNFTKCVRVALEPLQRQGMRKLHENLSNSCSDSSVHWHEARLVHHASHFDRSQISGNCKDGCKISNRQDPAICRLPPSSWNAGGSNTSGAAGNAATPTSSTLAEFTTPISHDPNTCVGNSDSSMFSHSETLVPQRSSSQGCSLGSPPCKERSCNNRCIFTRLGSCVETPESEGSVARRDTAHQCSQDEGSMASAVTISTSVKGQACPNKNRQYHSGVLYQTAGGDKISEPVKFGTKALEMGGYPSPLSESQVSFWSLQSNGGFSVSGQSHTLGLADSQGSDSGNLGHLWQGRGGFICRQADNSLSDVVFRHGRARGSGPGCVATQLATLPRQGKARQVYLYSTFHTQW